jgi:hypothetical protein
VEKKDIISPQGNDFVPSEGEPRRLIELQPDGRTEPMTTNIPQSTALTETSFTEQEVRALEALRIRFQEDHDLMGTREWAHLRFLRWLVRTGRLSL